MTERWSRAWIEALDEAAQAVGGTGGERFVIQQVVEDERADGAGTAWHVVLTEDTVRVLPGAADDADVTFTQDRPTAESIVRGELAAGTALADGRLSVHGATTGLTRHRELLARLDEAWAGVTPQGGA